MKNVRCSSPVLTVVTGHRRRVDAFTNPTPCFIAAETSTTSVRYTDVGVMFDKDMGVLNKLEIRTLTVDLLL